ncbi:C-C motif chemokine 4-like [Protopterus annectens]|uniref:C-C motif chemokine 4-like n=1 Tax=Protopterus annectens TaxID=7888 RepID=UPI001CF98270|nr:C-C motif chemokine 4-like [Protopterus annectens]
MKIALGIFILAALIAFTSVPVSGAKAVNTLKRTGCCFSFRENKPHFEITTYYYTSDRCFIKAVVLIAKNGRKICVRKDAPWIDKYIKN